jgi:hypothetical protein
MAESGEKADIGLPNERCHCAEAWPFPVAMLVTWTDIERGMWP